MKIIGITGKSGSGKTTFAVSLAQKLNCKYIDIDKIGHEALFQQEILDELCEKIGKEILEEDGKVNRKKVGNIVFADRQKMDILTDLTWGYMQKVLDSMLLKSDGIVILDWILLPNSKYWDKCDLKILVKSDDKQRKNKVLERDKITSEYFDKRDSASLDYSEYKFDYIFENNYELDKIEEAIETIEKNV